MVPEILAERARTIRDDFRKANAGRPAGDRPVRRFLDRLGRRAG